MAKVRGSDGAPLSAYAGSALRLIGLAWVVVFRSRVERLGAGANELLLREGVEGMVVVFERPHGGVPCCCTTYSPSHLLIIL